HASDHLWPKAERNPRCLLRRRPAHGDEAACPDFVDPRETERHPSAVHPALERCSWTLSLAGMVLPEPEQHLYLAVGFLRRRAAVGTVDQARHRQRWT